MMEVQIERRDGLVLVAPSGDIDLSCSRDLQQSMRQALDGKPERVVVDLSRVPYMDSSGVATLVEAMQIARKQSTRLILCGLQDKVRSIFEIARLDRVFTIARSLEEANTA
ncbi:MAG: anti-sigma factor antagonist [Phycisphaeraceae bacterium]|nr:MAG: anti-sigma factor antagonist [Phycisphaeraceae bacterium]